jgi:NAD(P)H dehydrogenase (quinone)
MGNVLVLYHSHSGSTEKMARAVAEGAGRVAGVEVRVRSVREAAADDLLWCHGVAVGSPTNFGSVAWEMKRWWDQVPFDLWLQLDGKIGCAFSSSGGWGGGAELNCLTLLTILMNYGFLAFGLTDYVGKQFTAHYGAVLAGEPREEREFEACRRLGQRLAEWVAVYFDRRDEAHPLRQTYRRGPR